MSSMKLSNSEVRDHLAGMNGWEEGNGTISKFFEFANFIQSMEFVNELAESAEEVQHHPDIDIRYDKVRVALTTHDAGGLTQKDFDLANLADEFSEATTAGEG